MHPPQHPGSMTNQDIVTYNQQLTRHYFDTQRYDAGVNTHGNHSGGYSHGSGGAAVNTDGLAQLIMLFLFSRLGRGLFCAGVLYFLVAEASSILQGYSGWGLHLMALGMVLFGLLAVLGSSLNLSHIFSASIMIAHALVISFLLSLMLPLVLPSAMDWGTVAVWSVRIGIFLVCAYLIGLVVKLLRKNRYVAMTALTLYSLPFLATGLLFYMALLGDILPVYGLQLPDVLSVDSSLLKKLL